MPAGRHAVALHSAAVFNDHTLASRGRKDARSVDCGIANLLRLHAIRNCVAVHIVDCTVAHFVIPLGVLSRPLVNVTRHGRDEPNHNEPHEQRK
jgi:hypothetical protein